MKNRNLVSTFDVNTKGIDYIVGDIHGCFTKLQDKLDSVGFYPNKDRLFCTGDMVDRGDESHKALEWLSKPWFYSVMGNHELMLQSHVEGYLTAYQYGYNGGDWFVFLCDDNLKRDFYESFSELPIIIELNTAKGLVVIVHSQIVGTYYNDFKKELLSNDKEQSDRMLDVALWSRDRILKLQSNNIVGVHAVVSGHTPVDEPTILGNHYFIDTGACYDGYFTLLNTKTMEFV